MIKLILTLTLTFVSLACYAQPSEKILSHGDYRRTVEILKTGETRVTTTIFFSNEEQSVQFTEIKLLSKNCQSIYLKAHMDSVYGVSSTHNRSTEYCPPSSGVLATTSGLSSSITSSFSDKGDRNENWAKFIRENESQLIEDMALGAGEYLQSAIREYYKCNTAESTILSFYIRDHFDALVPDEYPLSEILLTAHLNEIISERGISLKSCRPIDPLAAFFGYKAKPNAPFM